MSVTLRITRDSDNSGHYTVHTESAAELLAYCLCAEQHVMDETVVCTGITADNTPLLQQALAAIARGKGDWVYVAGDIANVDGSR